MQRTARTFFFALAIESGCDSLRVGIHFDDGVEARTFLVDVRDAIGVFLDELREVYLPDWRPCCRSAMVSSSRSNAGRGWV